MNRTTMTGATVLLLAAAAGAWFFATPAAKPSHSAPSTASFASAPDGTGPDPAVQRFTTADGRTLEVRRGPDGASATLAGGGSWQGEASERRVMKLRVGGREYEFDPADDASFEAALAAAPEESREQLRSIREKVRASGPGSLGGLPGIPKNVEAAIQQDATASRDAIRQLIEAGMSPEEAARVVSQSLQDSIQTRFQRAGSDAKVHTEMVSSGDGGEQKVGLMLMITDDQTTTGEAPPPSSGK